MQVVLKFEAVARGLREQIAELRAWPNPSRWIVNPVGCKDRELEADLLQARLDQVEQYSSNGGPTGPDGSIVTAGPDSPTPTPHTRSVL
jgi:hypothetical protein